MNAGGVPNACKSHAYPSGCEWRTAEEHVGICLEVGDNAAKAVLIPHTFAPLAGVKKAAMRLERSLRPIR